MDNPMSLATLGTQDICLVCPMLPVSLDCSFLITPSVFSNVYCRPMSCVPSVASVFGLSIRDYSFGFLWNNPMSLATLGTQDMGRQ
jgi:hypothetical protein